MDAYDIRLLSTLSHILVVLMFVEIDHIMDCVHLSGVQNVLSRAFIIRKNDRENDRENNRHNYR